MQGFATRHPWLAASLQQTAQREMRRQLQSMEEIKEALEQSAGAATDKPASSEPAARASWPRAARTRAASSSTRGT